MEIREQEPALSDQEEAGKFKPEQKTPRNPLMKHIGKLAVVGILTTALSIATIQKVNDSPENKLGADPKPAAEAIYASAQFHSEGPTREKAEKKMWKTYRDKGEATGLFSPDRETNVVLDSAFRENGSSRVPTLKEIAYMQDYDLFRPEWENYITSYPFAVYNTTRHPIDLPFIDYAVRMTKSWMATENTKQYESLVIGDHTEIGVGPRAVPHYMIMTKTIPPDLKKELPESDGVTEWEENHTRSFIRPNGPKNNPFAPWIVGTEVCQSLVNVYIQRSIPGQESQQRDMQEYVASFNDDAEYDLDLAAQESVCNSLGRVLEAAYLGGQVSLNHLDLKLRDNKIDRSWLDYDIFEVRIPTFTKVAEGVQSSELDIVTSSNAELPTTHYYKQKRERSLDKLRKPQILEEALREIVQE